MCLKTLCRKLFCCCHPYRKGGFNEASFYEYSDALPKYYTDEVGELCEGVSLTFSGKISIHCERFSINFMYNNESRDVALHINPRLPQNYIVRNTKVRGVWGREEVSSALPFLLRRGDRFSIQVFITDACYMISINGNHFAEYSHRLPLNGVQILDVKGDVEDVEMKRAVVQAYPQRFNESAIRVIEAHLSTEADEVDANTEDVISIPHEWCLISAPSPKLENNSLKSHRKSIDQGLTLPYYGKILPKSLKEGRCLKIDGRVRLLPHSFYINLQQGHNIWPHPVIAFHLNPRFSQNSTGAIGKAIVCRNAWYNGSWAEEERSELDTNFSPGRTFSLVIACSANSFEVYVNRQFITEFKYHVQPDIVDTVYIQGDVKLWNVTLEVNPIIKGKHLRIYHNPLPVEEY
ncbi:galectin-9 isoform X3 [Drosophila hydei]|uniref:Galectin n=1 Tax=Drosophila hydei TaxID=7224 RepID=A0A6J1LJ00_DROHY|nr:galectin-9 isoform X3 [Drosophila hydei]